MYTLSWTASLGNMDTNTLITHQNWHNNWWILEMILVRQEVIAVQSYTQIQGLAVFRRILSTLAELMHMSI